MCKKFRTITELRNGMAMRLIATVQIVKAR
jgi:hypothetical protein